MRVFICLMLLSFVGCSSPSTSPPCAPACADLACGDDGCGGSCGACAADEVCSSGACTSCGNGALDDGETCDDSAGIDCPVAEWCESDDACWLSEYRGSPETCDAECATTGIVECGTGDGCCPTGCNPGNDADCAPANCGNGVLDPGEACDPPMFPCVTQCEPTQACESAVFWGYEVACSLECKRSEITSCSQTSDGCCPANCSDVNDADCQPAVCGDATISGNETCDTGITWPAPGSCSADCDDHRACTIDLMNGAVADCSVMCIWSTKTACIDGDGCCPSTCTLADDADCGAVVCGDGIIDGNEGCDSAIALGEPGACPASAADCDDHDPCTTDSVEGLATDCSARCVNQPRACADGDGCCPYTCGPAADAECAALNLCESYCFNAITYCTGEQELYADTVACEDACRIMPVGRVGDESGDSIQCRLHHLLDARSDPEGHCVHVGVTPMGGCE